MKNTKGYVDPTYLQTIAEAIQPIKQLTYERMEIKTGDKVMDLGCGPGTDTLLLAHLVSTTGQVVGIDYDSNMVSKANDLADQNGVAGWTYHTQSHASFVPFMSNHFDSCRSERLFQHLFDPEDALFEMARVTKSTGHVVVLDVDWGSLSVNSSYPDIERKIVSQVVKSVHNGYSGRRLVQMFNENTWLTDVTHQTFPVTTQDYNLFRLGTRLDMIEQQALVAGVITEAELEAWRADLEYLHDHDGFFCSVNWMMCVGRKI